MIVRSENLNATQWDPHHKARIVVYTMLQDGILYRYIGKYPPPGGFLSSPLDAYETNQRKMHVKGFNSEATYDDYVDIGMSVEESGLVSEDETDTDYVWYSRYQNQ